MKAKRRAGSVGKFLGCAALLLVALFPIYWLLAMAIRPTDEMRGHISLIPQTLTGEHFAQLFSSEGFGQAIIKACDHLGPGDLLLWASARRTSSPGGGSVRSEKAADLLGAAGPCAAPRGLHHPCTSCQQGLHPQHQAAGDAGCVLITSR